MFGKWRNDGGGAWTTVCWECKGSCLCFGVPQERCLLLPTCAFLFPGQEVVDEHG